MSAPRIPQAAGPWTLTKNSWQCTTIYDADGNVICRLDLEDWNVTEDNQDALESVQDQIARRIIDPVNAHSELVAALQEALEFIDNQADVVDGGYGIPAPNRAMQVAREIREALSKAGVE